MALTAAKDYVMSVSHATGYYKANSNQIADYYKLDNSNDNNIPLSFWHGKGAKQLNLSGEVENTDFAAIASNKTPEGDKLKPQNSSKSRIGRDITFTAPKSISLAYALMGDTRIVEIFKRAAETTLSALETKAKHRLTDSREGAKTGNIISACFIHRTTRPTEQTGKPDPHLHMHCFIMNATYSESLKQWRALDYIDINASYAKAERIFHLLLAKELKSIGYLIEWRNNKPEIKDIEGSLIDKFSNRSQEIATTAKENSLSMHQQQIYAKLSRSIKCNDTFQQLQSFWHERLESSDIKALALTYPATIHMRNPSLYEEILSLYDLEQLSEKELEKPIHQGVR
jgi:conjugative relaxase-like TrwC/TraI family protein